MGLVNVKSKNNRIEYTGNFPNGVWFKKEYNEDGKIIYMGNYKGEWEKWEYDNNGNVIFFEDFNGYWARTEYDENGKQIYWENSWGNIEDDRPQVNEGLVNVKSKNNRIEYYGDFPNGVWYKKEYDENRNEIYFEDSDGEWEKNEYDEKGNWVYYINFKGEWDRWEYDENGNEIYWENSKGEWDKTEYDQNGELIYWEDSHGQVMDYREEPINEGLVNVIKKPRKNWALVMYRDATNTKTYFNVEIPEELKSSIEVGRDYDIEDFGFSEERMWDFIGSEYDEEVDHNIVEVLELMPEPDPDYRTLDNELNENKKNMMEQTLNTGKLKLMEVLSPTDIKQIVSLAADEAKKESNKVKNDLSKDITDLKKKDSDIKQTIDKHIQDKENHLTKTDVIKLAKDEDGKVDMDKKIDDKIAKVVNSKELDKKVKELFTDSMSEYHKTLWTKRGFWSGNLKI